jgi:hypothetical protein
VIVTLRCSFLVGAFFAIELKSPQNRVFSQHDFLKPFKNEGKPAFLLLPAAPQPGWASTDAAATDGPG